MPALLVLLSSPYGLGAVLPLPLPVRGELCWASAAGLAPPTLLPSAFSLSSSLLLALVWCPASPPRAQEGLAELSSRPGDLARTQASLLRGAAPASCLSSKAARCGLPRSRSTAPFCVCGREQQCWKKVLGYNHGNGKPAQSCLCLHGKGLSAPAVCQCGSDVAVICFGDKGVLHPPALLNTGPLKHWLGIPCLTPIWNVAFLRRL